MVVGGGGGGREREKERERERERDDEQKKNNTFIRTLTHSFIHSFVHSSFSFLRPQSTNRCSCRRATACWPAPPCGTFGTRPRCRRPAPPPLLARRPRWPRPPAARSFAATRRRGAWRCAGCSPAHHPVPRRHSACVFGPSCAVWPSWSCTAGPKNETMMI